MKLKRLDQYLDFIMAVQDCEADVYFNSAEGDHLNLHSVLSQYLFASICGNRRFLEAGEVECDHLADVKRQQPFFCIEGDII